MEKVYISVSAVNEQKCYVINRLLWSNRLWTRQHCHQYPQPRNRNLVWRWKVLLALNSGQADVEDPSSFQNDVKMTLETRFSRMRTFLQQEQNHSRVWIARKKSNLRNRRPTESLNRRWTWNCRSRLTTPRNVQLRLTRLLNWWKRKFVSHLICQAVRSSVCVISQNGPSLRLLSIAGALGIN